MWGNSLNPPKLTATMTALPKPASSTAYVDISIIPTGTLSLPDYFLHKDGSQESDACPDYAFLIEHHALGKKLFFDLGLAHDLDIFSPFCKTKILTMFDPQPPRQSLADMIRDKKGIPASDINQVVFSHVHFYHCYPFSSFLPKATALFGPGSINHVKPGWPVQDSPYFSELVDPNHPWHSNVHELPSREDKGWKPFGTFDHAWDLFGDDSFWIIDAPGHIAGNLAAAGRLKNGEWVIMGGDCCHSRQLLEGSKEIGTWKEKDGSESCMHGDRKAAMDTIRRLRKLGTIDGVHIAMAHVKIDELHNEKLNALMI